MNRKDVFWGLFLALVVALILSPVASSRPDGLEWVAGGLGFLSKGEGTAVLSSPIADYAFSGISHPRLATALAGLVGTLIMFALGYWVAYFLKRRNS